MFGIADYGAFVAAMSGATAIAAEPIEGKWLRPSTNTLVQFKACGGNSYCGTVLTGEFKGKSIGKLSGNGGSYKGTVNALDEGKSYSGKATVNGNSMKLSGCVMGGLICKGENWSKQ